MLSLEAGAFHRIYLFPSAGIISYHYRVMLILLAVRLLFAFPTFADVNSCPDAKPSLLIDNKDMLGQVTAANGAPYAKNLRFQASIPEFLQNHIGPGPDQIPGVVLERARELFLQKRKERKSKNVCYAAMDATRPHLINEEEADKGGPLKLGHRLFLICESLGIFKALPVSHGGGVDLRKQNPNLNLKNGRRCAKYFGNVLDGFFTMGGNYLTDTIKYSYKGKLLQKDKSYCDYSRPFLRFTGEGETANSAQREIGAHPVLKMGKGKERCDPTNPHKDAQGYVYFADKLENYNGGRTEGCLGMPEDAATTFLAVARDHPMSVYVYPQKQDIEKMAGDGPKPYWNEECLKEIGSPAYFGVGMNSDLEQAIAMKHVQTKSDVHIQRPDCPAVVPGVDFDNDSKATLEERGR